MKRFFVAAALLSSTAFSPNAFAATQSASMAASATVTTICSITTTALPFSEVALTALTAGTATVSVTCTNGGTYNVGFDTGLNATGTQRFLVSGANKLSYGLYQDNAYATAWGSTVGTDTVAGTGNGAVQTIPVFAKIDAGQTLTTGSYADTVQAIVTY